MNIPSKLIQVKKNTYLKLHMAGHRYPDIELYGDDSDLTLATYQCRDVEPYHMFERLDVEGAFLVDEFHQVDRGQVTGAVIEEHVL